ncbi:MAG: NAD-dependent epimerase/dehydratase family protein, partial [Gemmatimonadetes bacterium]|nr:NAD-dependent epimerase/dehydratase family protein [Gemmatimonadota bacterium]
MGIRRSSPGYPLVNVRQFPGADGRPARNAPALSGYYGNRLRESNHISRRGGLAGRSGSQVSRSPGPDASRPRGLDTVPCRGLDTVLAAALTPCRAAALTPCRAGFNFRHTMTILVTGGSGLIGRRLIPCLEQRDHRVFRLVRSRELTGDRAVYWSTSEGGFDWDKPGSVDAVVHLAGESILGRWTGAKKARIRDSRVGPTRNLCAFLAGMASPPSVLVCASATGYYGDRGDEPLGEASPPGEGFLPRVSRQWEAATEPARDAGVRVVNLRIGMVLTPEGGA